MKTLHFLYAPIKTELSDWRLWWTRAVIIGVAALSGLTVVAFTAIAEHALATFFALRDWHGWLPLLLTPLSTAAIVWLTRRHAATAAGSGIPQVMAALDPALAPHQIGHLASLRLSLSKIALTSWGLLAGLSLGREGPSVQVAAGIMLLARRLLPRRCAVNAHGLLVAGGAAGMAAAFNTPLAGIMFAIEELSRTPEQRNSGLLVTAIVLAGVIAISINGNATYFGVIHVAPVGLALLLPGLLAALGCGLAGGLFSRLLIGSLGGQGGDRYSRWRRRRPVLFALACGMAVAAIGVVTDGTTFGSGYMHTRNLLEGTSHVSPLYALHKLIATWLSAWSGAPAGIFAPCLAIGAAIGSDVAMLFQGVPAPALIALGMVGFLAAVTQAPLTSFIIVMEMVDGHTMVLSLMACALIACAISRRFSPPLYATLALGFVPGQPAAAPPRRALHKEEKVA